jgi:hypothetical protein
MLRDIRRFLRLHLTRVALFVSTALLLCWVLVSRPPPRYRVMVIVCGISNEMSYTYEQDEPFWGSARARHYMVKSTVAAVALLLVYGGIRSTRRAA